MAPRLLWLLAIAWYLAYQLVSHPADPRGGGNVSLDYIVDQDAHAVGLGYLFYNTI